jgi:hypothetical protein
MISRPQFNDIRIFDPQMSDEKPLQKSTEKINSCPGKGLEKTLDRMRGCHMFQMGFNSSGIACIFFELIEIAEPPAGSIDHKAKDLLEKLKNTKTFSVFADGAEKTLQPGKDFNGMEIFHKQSQTRSSGQTVMRLFNLANLQFLFTIIFAILSHKVLHLLGVACRPGDLVVLITYTSKLPPGEGLFCFINRSV